MPFRQSRYAVPKKQKQILVRNIFVRNLFLGCFSQARDYVIHCCPSTTSHLATRTIKDAPQCSIWAKNGSTMFLFSVWTNFTEVFIEILSRFDSPAVLYPLCVVSKNFRSPLPKNTDRTIAEAVIFCLVYWLWWRGHLSWTNTPTGVK